MEILKTVDLKKYYGSGENQVKALDGVNLSVEEGEFVSVVGTSGSGKSTLLHMLGGLDYATSGSVFVSGKEIFKLNESELTIFRRRNIGFIFQNYNLVPVLNVYENIVLPIQLDGEKPDRRFIQEIMEMLGIQNKKNSMPNQLSGGQQRAWYCTGGCNRAGGGCVKWECLWNISMPSGSAASFVPYARFCSTARKCCREELW